MNTSVPDPTQGETGVSSTAGPGPVTVRYWAAAKAAAGSDHDEVFAGTVAEALAAVTALHVDSPRFAQVLGVCSFLLRDAPLGSRDPSEVPVEAGDVIEVLPPFAGG